VLGLGLAAQGARPSSTRGLDTGSSRSVGLATSATRSRDDRCIVSIAVRRTVRIEELIGRFAAEGPARRRLSRALRRPGGGSSRLGRTARRTVVDRGRWSEEDDPGGLRRLVKLRRPRRTRRVMAARTTDRASAALPRAGDLKVAQTGDCSEASTLSHSVRSSLGQRAPTRTAADQLDTDLVPDSGCDRPDRRSTASTSTAG